MLDIPYFVLHNSATNNEPGINERLALNPHLLAQMDTAHLLASLAAEGPLTPAEIELSRRLEALCEEETSEEIEARLEKTYASALEQSEFRRELIERIVEMCGQAGTKKDLVKAITTALENSYVEL